MTDLKAEVWNESEDRLTFQTCRVERRVPIHLEDKAHQIITEWLKSEGFKEDGRHPTYQRD